MIRRLDALSGRRPADTVQRFSLDDLAEQVKAYEAQGWPLSKTTWGVEKAESIDATFTGYVNAAYKRNGIVFAVILARLALFSEVRFCWRNSLTRETFGNADLEVLERPWPNGTTGNLLARMEQDASLAGNSFWAMRPPVDGHGPRLRRMRPDWVKIVVGSPSGDPTDLDAEPIGYMYMPNGPTGPKERRVMLLPEEVAHFAPIPDPDAQWRGMSWLTPVLDELRADGMATRHKLKFFENAATPNLSVSLDKEISPTAFAEFVDLMDERHAGALNAYKTLYTGGGADVRVVGTDLKNLDFKNVQGAGETRICAAGGVPPIIVGLSEGLQASTYSNYGQARRKFGDHWARPQWRIAAGALDTIVPNPAGAQLWYDPEGIAFLQEDLKDDAEIQAQRASTIRTYVEAGFTAASAVKAVETGNLALLEHTGLTSVQLQKPGNDSAKEA